MTAIATGSQGREWLTEVLSTGMSLSTWVRRNLNLDHLSMHWLVNDPSLANSTDIRGGVGSPTPWGELTDRIRETWPNAVVYVEMPLALASDPVMHDLGSAIVTCDEEVYGFANTWDGPERLADTLKAHDPSSLYVAMVAVSDGQAEPLCPVATLEGGSISLRCVVVGAFDGEGFLVCEQST